MMAVLGVILYLIYLAVCIALAVMGLTLAYMPYVLGGIASLIIYSQNPGIQKWIPGHPWMCFIVLLALVEAGIAVLMQIKHVSRAVITFFCCVFMGAIGAVVFEELTPDSMGYPWGIAFLSRSCTFCFRYSQYGSICEIYQKSAEAEESLRAFSRVRCTACLQ